MIVKFELDCEIKEIITFKILNRKVQPYVHAV